MLQLTSRFDLARTNFWVRCTLKIRHWWLKNKERKVDFRFVEREFLAAINRIIGFYHFEKTNVRYSLIHLYTVFCCTSACIHSYKSTENFPPRLCRYGDRLIGWPFCYCQLCCWEHTRWYLSKKSLVILSLFFLPWCSPRILPFCFQMCERLWMIWACTVA